MASLIINYIDYSKINALFTELNGTPVNVVNKFTKAIKKRNFARTRSKKIARHTLKGFM